jgi:hypothetical protein
MENLLLVTTKTIRRIIFGTPVVFSLAIMVGAFLIGLSPHLSAQTTWNQYEIVRNIDAIVASKITGWSDAAGMVGSNSHPVGEPGSFLPDNQRGATEAMVGGIASHDRGIVPLATCDQNVALGFKAIQSTYDLQTDAGNFYKTVTENADGTVVGSGSSCVSNDMHFFLAWSNNALTLLQADSRYGPMYAAQLNALMPKIQKAMDYYYAPDGVNPSYLDTSVYTNPSSGDWGSPNRSLTNATAYAAGATLLSNYSTAARLTNYRTAAKWWVDNVFVQSEFYTMRPMFDDMVGNFFEASPYAGACYDTSYQGVGLRFLCMYACHSPGDISDVAKKILTAGRFLERRFLPSDPLGLVSGPVIDCTDSTRTGPMGSPGDGTAGLDAPCCRVALCYYDAMVNSAYATNQSDGTTAASRFINYTASQNVGNPTRPPVIINRGSDLVVSVPVGQTMTPLTVMATNSGILGNGLATLDPNFAIQVSGLPAGISAGPVYSYELHNPRLFGELNQSVGFIDIEGTPTVSGTYTATLTPMNSNVTYIWTSSTHSAVTPTYVINGVQNGTSLPLTIRVRAPQVYEAENGTYGSGAAKRADISASGGYYIGSMHHLGAYNQISYVDGGLGGNCTVQIRYSIPLACTLSLYVNGAFLSRVSLPGTGGWVTFSTCTFPITLNAGNNNTIRLQEDPADNGGGGNIDSYTVSTP